MLCKLLAILLKIKLISYEENNIPDILLYSNTAYKLFFGFAHVRMHLSCCEQSEVICSK